MLPLVRRRPTASADPTALVLAPHHPDRLRRPTPRLATGDEARRQALTWNVFRTLDLIAPAFWLRRFNLRLTGEASLVTPQMASVQLWRPLPLPPIRRIDGGRTEAVADVVIETEHQVWTLLVPADGPEPDIDARAADLLDAGSWLAGRRAHQCGAVERDGAIAGAGTLLRARYRRSRDSAAVRSAARGPAAPGHEAWGVVRWSDLAAILDDCAQADSLPAIERALAAHALAWLRAIGRDRAAADRST